ncbi:MAG: hypothetical protein ABIQ31_13500 [Ferruginibacter sp.]
MKQKEVLPAMAGLWFLSILRKDAKEQRRKKYFARLLLCAFWEKTLSH